MPVKNERAVYQLKVSVDGIFPAIWRRLQIAEDATLSQLHHAVQVLFGWLDYHLHEFVIEGRTFAEPDEEDAMYRPDVRDERAVPLSAVMKRVGTLLIYRYDFGDDWSVSVMLEAIVLPEDGVSYPRCMAGERAGPPEDIGGPPGYQDYVEAIADPRYEQHREMLQRDGEFDPERFEIAALNQELAARFKERARQAVASAGTAGGRKAATGAEWPSNIISILGRGAATPRQPRPRPGRPTSRKPKQGD